MRGRAAASADGRQPWGGPVDYSSADVRRVAAERRMHGDLIVLQLAAGPELHPRAYPADVLRGRVLSLQAWLRAARRPL